MTDRIIDILWLQVTQSSQLIVDMPEFHSLGNLSAPSTCPAADRAESQSHVQICFFAFPLVQGRNGKDWCLHECVFKHGKKFGLSVNEILLADLSDHGIQEVNVTSGYIWTDVMPTALQTPHDPPALVFGHSSWL